MCRAHCPMPRTWHVLTLPHTAGTTDPGCKHRRLCSPTHPGILSLSTAINFVEGEIAICDDIDLIKNDYTQESCTLELGHLVWMHSNLVCSMVKKRKHIFTPLTEGRSPVASHLCSTWKACD
eukprot:scpid79168/ scgid6955/ 